MKQEVKLAKTLTLFQVVFLGLAWMTPMIYFSIYGIAYEASQGMLTQAYSLAFLAIVFTAYSYSIMARAYPTSGSAYTYVKKAIHPYLGFLVGWAILLDYLFSPIIACLTFGIYMHAQFPSIPAAAWMIVINVAVTIVNLRGVNISANLSKIIVLLQMGFIALFCILLAKQLSDVSAPLHPFLQTDVPLPTVLAGASMICFSFLGFDSVSNMSEETKNSGKNIPKAIFIIILTASVLYIVPSLLTQLVFPHITFLDVDSAGLEIVKMVGGAGLSAIFIVVLMFAIFSQGLSSVTSVSRLLYVMGRESILPKRWFGMIHSKYKTPAFNILFTGIISLFALVISLDTAVKFVNFGALTAFIFINLSVIFKRYIKDRQRSPLQTVLYLICPIIGMCVVSWLLSLLDTSALMMGAGWLLFGIVYRLYKTKWVSNRSVVFSE
ncbi:APC family permease [Paenibacillus solisilvae]|uniref:APC family permease n=1 Tax=Paenibacillus solisilvae TaxID=2486751 RepID=A0ABW0W2D9_9BACL